MTMVALAAVASGMAWLLHLTNPSTALEARTQDWRFLFRGPLGNVSDDIVLVLVEDDADLDYRSPIPRRHLAAVVDRLSAARLVGLDILLDEPSFDTEGDTLLRDALARRGSVVAVSYVEDGEEHEPHPFFRQGMLDIGYATFGTGTDIEIVRRGTIARSLGEKRAVSLAGVLYAHRLGVDPEAIRGRSVDELVDGSDVERSLVIDFSNPPNAVCREQGTSSMSGFIVCPSHLVAAGVYPRQFFRDKIVMIGSGMSDAPDRFRTPFFAASYGYEKMLGVEVHAHFLQMLVSGTLLQTWDEGWALLLSVCLALIVSATMLCSDVVKSGVLLVVLVLGLVIVAFVLFSEVGVVVPLMLPLETVVASYVLATAYYGVTEGRQRRRTRQLFDKYLSPEVIEEFLEDPSQWELGGKRMDITVMFADLEGFTPMSEALTPEELVKLMNFHLNEMTGIILEEEGTIDKYEGDLIMAFFGAPMPMDDHAERGCRAALRMQERLGELRESWRAQGLPELRMRIGIHSAAAVVGNMGSDFRFNYTAMGDTVNLASRLEGANKDFGTYTMVSAATREQVGSTEMQFRDLGTTTVKGKSEAIEVFELLPAG